MKPGVAEVSALYHTLKGLVVPLQVHGAWMAQPAIIRKAEKYISQRNAIFYFIAVFCCDSLPTVLLGERASVASCVSSDCFEEGVAARASSPQRSGRSTGARIYRAAGKKHGFYPSRAFVFQSCLHRLRVFGPRQRFKKRKRERKSSNGYYVCSTLLTVS